MAQRLASCLVLACCLALAACGSPLPPAPVDAAGVPDSYTRADAFVIDSCDPAHLHVLMGTMGTVGIDLDTSMSTTRPRDLGPACGNPASDIRWANQEVIEFHVPGTGMQGVSFSTNNSMTAFNFNTVLEIRQGDCRTAPGATIPPSCFDDISQTNLQSAGGATVMGGSTLYVFVTGYTNPPPAEMAVDHGTVHVDFTVNPNTAPTITTGSAVFSRADTLIDATGTDQEGPIAGYLLAFYNAAGQIDLTGDGMITPADQLLIGFDTVDRAAPMYTGHSHINGMTQYALATYCHGAAHCTQFGLRLFDQQYAVSNELRVPIENAAIVGIGAACDIRHLCGAGTTCSGTCLVNPAATTECMNAMPITIATPTTAATSADVSNNIGTGMGVFESSCGITTGKENIWSLVVPAGTFDLALTTDIPASGQNDTILYVRSACADQSTELAMGCNDDISGSNFRSSLAFRNIAPGTYYVFVEAYGGMTAFSYGLRTTLTPVLPAAAACDPAMTNYRCANGACGAASHTCP